uniref:Uncharacterized protein n=1 Tax=Panagrellus redivivus TaxID=6233 RepID=A0A7E4ZQ99_PANRE
MSSLSIPLSLSLKIVVPQGFRVFAHYCRRERCAKSRAMATIVSASLASEAQSGRGRPHLTTPYILKTNNTVSKLLMLSLTGFVPSFFLNWCAKRCAIIRGNVLVGIVLLPLIQDHHSLRKASLSGEFSFVTSPRKLQ